SPLRYRINRLGGRSMQEKWILQAELFNECHRWVKQGWSKIEREGTDRRNAEKYYAILRDFLKAAPQVFAEAWGNDSYMVTTPVVLKALIRVGADLAGKDAEPVEGRVERWRERLAPLGERVRDFRKDGFMNGLRPKARSSAWARFIGNWEER